MKLVAPSFEYTLAAVRHISETAMLRPAPRILWTTPFLPFRAPLAQAAMAIEDVVLERKIKALQS
jgi:hypothetical protein